MLFFLTGAHVQDSFFNNILYRTESEPEGSAGFVFVTLPSDLHQLTFRVGRLAIACITAPADLSSFKRSTKLT